jgi:spermidine synthase
MSTLHGISTHEAGGVRPHTWRVGALLFGSGACALVYQIAWLREFRLFFGASTAASAAVLAIFLGGLGLGGLLLGRRADRVRRPILLYSNLEAIVALSAAASPFLLAFAREIYLGVGGTQQLGLAAGTAGRLALSTLVLAVPTLAMGGTLPAAARGVTRHTDARRQDAAALYALNTLGAVTGCLLATFLLLEVFGTRMTVFLAAAVNLLVAVVARQVDRLAPELGEAAGVTDEPPPASRASAPAPFVLVASGVVGFSFFLMELVWYRMLGPLLGGSVFTFGLVLAVALAGIGVGGLLYALIAADRPASLAGFAVSCLLEAAAIAIGYALGDRIAVLALVLLPLGQIGFGAQVAGWTLVTAVVVLLPAVVAGFQFPLLIALLGRGRERVGRQIGLAYATNTAGAILGSLAGGFGLLPWLSAVGAWRLVTLLLLALGAAAAVLSALQYGRGRRVPLLSPGTAWPLALTAATLALIMASGPTAVWRHGGVGAGRAPAAASLSPNQLRDWGQITRRTVVWDGDGRESSVALVLAPPGYAFIVNGKSDGNARSDAGTQVMLGLLGGILNPNARRSLVIGLGTGSTAGWLGAIPSMDRVDVIELEPLVVDVARACHAVSERVLENPKVHVTIGDARELLLTTKEQYDIIASEPSNPFRAGVASLFTREYYQAASDRLSADGLFVQWVQGYEIDTRTLRTAYATMASVFPHVETWQATSHDLLLVGARRPLAYRAGSLAARIQEEPFRTALRVAWRAVDLNGVLAHYLASDRLARTLAAARGIEVNTDDRNVIEFGFARSVGRGPVMVTSIRDLARTMGAGRPHIDDDPRIQWTSVDTAWVSFLAGHGAAPGVRVQGPPEEVVRQAALLQFYINGDSAAARRLWHQQTRAPIDPSEVALVAAVEADAGSETAVAYIEQLRAFQPGEADTILAELRARQSRDADAAAALASAFRRFRTDPWPLTFFKRRAVALASTLAKRQAVLAPGLFQALKEPFAIRSLEGDRLALLAELTPHVDFRGLCQAAMTALEPHVPWNEPFLSLRRNCYQALGDPRADKATRDVIEFASQEPMPLESGLAVR